MFKRPWLILLALSVGVFAIAMASPALSFEELCAMGNSSPAGLFQPPVGAISTWHGLYILLVGTLGMVFMPQVSFGWLANPIYAAALISLGLRKTRLAAALAAVSLLVGISGTLWTAQHPLPADEGGICWLYLNQFKAGFWLWVAAQALLLLAPILNLRKRSG